MNIFLNYAEEDEFIASCRLKSMFTAFAVSMVYYLAQAALPILYTQAFSYSGFRVLSFQLFTYLIYFHIAIRGGVFNHAE